MNKKNWSYLNNYHLEKIISDLDQRKHFEKDELILKTMYKFKYESSLRK